MSDWSIGFLVLFATLFVRAEGVVLTRCNPSQRGMGFTNISEIVFSLALEDNEKVMQFVNETQGVESFDLYQCTYAYPEGTPVVKATAICESDNLNKCVTLATYQGSMCRDVTLCPTFFDRTPSFTTDCSGISSAYESCTLTCSSNSSFVSGMDTCAIVAPSSTPLEAPTQSPSSNSLGSIRIDVCGTILTMTVLLITLLQ